MSTYATASSVVIATWISTEEFRAALRAAVPAGVTTASPTQAATSITDLTARLEDAVASRLLTASEAATARGRIAAAQRRVVSHAMTDTLTSLGFQVTAADAATDRLWAERNHEVVAVEVHDGGGFAYDIGGLHDSTCEELARDIVTGLQARGISFATTARQHNDPRGGQLVRRVQASTRKAGNSTNRRAVSTQRH